MERNTFDVAAANALRKRLAAPPKLDLAENIRAAMKSGSRDYIRRLVKAVRGPGSLTIHEFFYYRLYDPAVADASISCFVGKRAQNRMHLACNDRRWYATCHDKLLWSAILKGAGLSIPETVAVFSEKGRFGIYPPLANQSDLARFLGNARNDPLFCKPVDGMFSIGAFRIQGAEGNTLDLDRGERRSVDEIARFMSSLSPDGYLLQKALKPAAALQATIGSALSSIRFLVLLTSEGPSLESAVMKIPARDGVADNYWREGSMIGAIDLAAGILTRVVTGTGSNLKSIDSSSAEPAELVGMTVPDFDAARSLCIEASKHFTGIRTQSWDVATTAAGPVLLELNFGGDLNLHQLAHGRGILSESYCRHLRACGYRGSLPKSG